MTDIVNGIFKNIEFLNKLDVPFAEGSEEYRSVVSLSVSPALVEPFQNIISRVDIEPLQQLPWFVWLSTLCRKLLEGVQHLDEVASVFQISTVRASISKLVGCVVLPSLPCQLPYPSTVIAKYQLTDKQRLSCVDLVVRTLLLLMENAHTRGGVLRHYGELLGALLSLNSASSCGSVPVVDPNRSFYKQAVTSLLDDVHQTTVFTHLMILHSTKGDGGRISRVVRKVLDTKLQRAGGVEALLSSTLLSDQAPCSTQDILKITNLLTAKHPETFYEAVLPQVLELLKKKECKGHQVTAGCIALLQERDPSVCESYFMAPMLAPLEAPCTEGEMEIMLICLKAWVDAAPPEISLSRPLPLLCLLYACINQSRTSLKSNLSSVLLACFSRLPLPCTYSISFIFPPDPGVFYSLTSSCSVVSVVSDKPLDYYVISKIILDFINDNKLTNIKVDIYRSLLQYVVSADIPLDRKIIATELLTELSSEQSILESLSDEPRYLVHFLKDLFSNDSFDSDSVSLGLMLLTVFLNDKLVHKKSNWGLISELEKPLLKLTKSPEIEIKTLAHEIFTRLTDLDVIKVDKSEMLTTDNKSEELTKKKNTVEDKGIVVDCDFDEAFKESMDPHLPVRAHALRRLAKLLQAKDRTTLNNKTTLLNLFKANLDDSDSYLYLSAVEGLSSLATTFPDDIIPALCREFISKQGKPDFRLKIGQVIVKTTNTMGEMGAAYKKELLAALLIGARDPDPYVRASSLSNIGEIAKVLSFQIHDSIVEVLQCAECVIDSDKEMEPRRAAVLLVSLMLQGLSNHIFSVLGDALPSLYRKLKDIYQNDRDEVTRLHAQVALEHLSHIMRNILFSEPQLSKLISMMDISKP